MGKGNNFASPTVAYRKGDYRVINLAKKSQYDNDAYVLERLDSKDAMDIERWLRCGDDGDKHWLIEQVGKMAEKLEENNIK